jgi:hypothetical protein
MANDDRFDSISEAEMHEIVEHIDAANTDKQTNTAVRTFSDYCSLIKQTTSEKQQ